MQRGDGSNAYSWWCASHIRTNQSKWLDGNLQEMEDMVQSMLKIIKEDADSFAKRAEMYYKRRPELISFVEETYRTYRALAERYDRISGELHKVNHSLATAFPDVEFPMQDEDDDSSPTEIDPADSVEVPSPKPPELPQINLWNKRSENNPATKEGIERLNSKSQPKKVTSRINEDEANEAIDKLQKSILVLQTEKEFMKSSYASGVSKFWEIEKQITEMQEKVGFLQDEFSIDSDTEEDEAQALMAVAAFNSCKNTLFNLQEQQRRSVEEMRIESERLKFAKEKLKALESECGQPEREISDENTGTSSSASDLQQGSLDLQSICDRVKDHFEINSDTSAMELTEKIDKLVNKVFGLELAVSSQTAQINRLRTEADHCQKHLSSLDEGKTSLIDDSSSMSDRLEQTLEELHKIQNFEKHVEHEENVLCASFTEACHSPSHISEELQSSKQMDQVEAVDPYAERSISIPRMESRERSEELEISKKIQDARFKVDEEATLHPKDEEIQMQSVSVPQLESDSRKSQILEKEDEVRERNSPQTSDSNSPSHDPEAQSGEPEVAPHLKQLLLNGLEGEEKILLDEYTSIIQNYKETKTKFLEVEKKNHEYFSETRTEVNELKSASAVKDDEIRSLQVILGSLQTNTKLRDSITTNSPNLEGTNNRDASSGIQDGVSLRAEEGVKPCHTDEPQTMLPIEEKFRKDINKLHDENLGFWLRFGTLFREIQRFGIEFQNIQAEIDKLEDSKAQEGNKTCAQQAGKSESAPINKQLRELKTELQEWIEQSALLSGELKSRFSSFCNIQEEISGVLKESAEADIVQFTPLQAAMLQGEVLNMKRENDKVIDELQAGLDHVEGLQADVEKTSSNLLKLHEKLELAMSKSGRRHFRNFSSKRRGVSLQAFLYGVKPKKPSIFSCVNPALQRQFSDLGAGRPI